MPADPSDPRAWMTRAYSNLHLAEHGRGKDVLLEDLCFNTQQAAEKALKAVCLLKGLEFPKTHSIVRLLDILESGGVAIPETVKAADILTQ
ncbi:MAG: HEPN domain-containing protein [Chloroflexota bacterium]